MKVLCPLCGIDVVTVGSWEFTDTSVEVPVCGSCSAETGTVSLRLRTSAVSAMTEVDGSAGVRHQDGFVVLSGGGL